MGTPVLAHRAGPWEAASREPPALRGRWLVDRGPAGPLAAPRGDLGPSAAHSAAACQGQDWAGRLSGALSICSSVCPDVLLLPVQPAGRGRQGWLPQESLFCPPGAAGTGGLRETGSGPPAQRQEESRGSWLRAHCCPPRKVRALGVLALALALAGELAPSAACSLRLQRTPAAAPADRLAVGINSSTFTLRSLEVNSFPARAGKAGGAGSGCMEPREGGGGALGPPPPEPAFLRRTLRCHLVPSSLSVALGIGIMVRVPGPPQPAIGTSGSQVGLGNWGGHPPKLL